MELRSRIIDLYNYRLSTLPKLLEKLIVSSMASVREEGRARNTKRLKFGKEDNVVHPIKSLREVCINRVHLRPQVESHRQITRINSQV